MAYGSWINKGWLLVKDVYDTNYNQYGYEIHVEWGYRQDKVANKTEYRATRVKLVSKNGHRVYSSDNTTAGMGVGSDSSYRVTKDKLDTLMDKAGDEVIQDLTDVSRVVSHNADGTLSTYCSICGKYYVNVNVSGVPANEWYTKEITSSIPAIDRSAGTAGISVASKTHKSVTLTLTSNVYADVCRYRINSGDWIEFSTTGTNIAVSGGGSISKTITGLSPNTKYTIEFQVCKTTNGVWSSSASTTFTTNKPAAPAAGSVSVSSKTYNSITCAISGFSFGDGAGYGKYQWSLNNSTWNDIGSNTSFTVTGLSPNTKYTIYARLVDNYGTASSSVSTSATTNKPSVPTKGSVSVSNITAFGGKFSWSGFSFGSGATWGKYQYSLNGSTWTDCGTNTSVTLNNLTPEKAYTFYVRLVDNYGTASSNATVSFTTLVDQAKVSLKDNGTWKKGKVFYKKDGAWVKVKKIYKKENGSWKLSK